MSKQNKLKGVIVPVITPVDTYYNIDETAFRQVIRRCIDAGVDGIFAGGSAGMGPLLTESMWIRCMEIAHDEVGDDCHLLGGVITTSTKRALEKIRILEEIGFGQIAVTPTFYISLATDQEMISHFAACRNATSMDIIGYNIPSCTQSSISVSAMSYMCEQGWFTAIKESSGDRKYFLELLDVARANGVSLLQGSEVDIEWGFSIGANGIVPVCANFDPLTFVSIYQASLKKDLQMVSLLQERLTGLREISQVSHGGNWISGIMYAVSMLGIGNGIPLLPIQPLNDAGQAHVSKIKPLESIEELSGIAASKT